MLRTKTFNFLGVKKWLIKGETGGQLGAAFAGVTIVVRRDLTLEAKF